jgi:hypothetical protein
MECSICDFWKDDDGRACSRGIAGAAPHPRREFRSEDPLNEESCPRCGSHDVVLMQRDALVQSFSCSICHQRWLATRPWPLLREARRYGA